MKVRHSLKHLSSKWNLWRMNSNHSNQLNTYIRNGRRPWSEGYELFKWRFIQQAIADASTLEKFRDGLPLPETYGEFLDERVVEYPWILSKIAQLEGELLDAGSTLNYECIVRHKALENKRITVLTLAPEANCFWNRGISYLFSDIRRLPFKDNFFDIAVSISTLEHVGMDNTKLYTSEDLYKEDSKYDFINAVKELHRVLQPGKKCFITVPFGKYQHDGFQQQFNAEMVDALISAFNPSSFVEIYYKYDNGGWDISAREECNSCSYFNIHKTKYFDKTSLLDYEDDFAAAARAIVTLEMIK